MKRCLGYFLIIVLLFNAAGCASLPKKFIRKKKQPAHTPASVYLAPEGPYQKKYSNAYYYKTHYTFWKTWHDELLLRLGGNHKKVERSAEEALGELREMSQYLSAQKQSELAAPIGDLERLVTRLGTTAVSASDESAMRVDLEAIRRRVANDFYYDKVKADILPDKVDLGSPGA